MSRNLIEMLRAREGEAPATALTVLKEAMDERGEISDDDRRRAADGLGPARGDRLRGLDLLRRPSAAARQAPRLRVHRHRLLGRDFGEHVREVKAGLGLGLGERSADGEVSLGQTVCLGFCHSGAAVRDGELVDAGEGARRARRGGRRCAQAPEPAGTSMLDEPVLLRRGDWSGLERALAQLSPEELVAEVKRPTCADAAAPAFPPG